MTAFKLHPEEGPDELTFYIEGHHVDSPNTALTFLVRTFSTQDAHEGLASRGYVSTAILQATPPTETGFRIRRDGTVLVMVYQSTSDLQDIYGPFNDESDANRWIHIKTSHEYDSGLLYCPSEPAYCFRIARINNIATILELPADFFSSPL
jgi:hypothetical protein